LSRFWKTLRFRLAVWNAVVVLLTAVATLLGLRQGVRWALLHEMDQILVEDIEEVSLALRQLRGDEFDVLTDELARKAEGHRQHGWFVQLCDAEHRIIWSSHSAAGAPGPGEIVFSPDPQTIDGFRLLQSRVDQNSSGISYIRVGSATEFVTADMQRIDRLVLLAAGVVLVAAPLVGYWLAGRATRHLGGIIETARRMRPDQLQDRMAIQGTGDELDQLAHTINRLLDRIADYLQEKRDFLANSAHELRTPLAAIRSSIEVALSGDRSVEEYQDLLVDIIDRGASLETLVNQLLLISESEGERLRMDFSPVRFHEVVRHSADMFAGVAESRNISLEVNLAEDVVVSGKPHLLRQIANNLIDNAIKYTPAGGRVTVTLQIDRPRNVAVFSVRDTGIGISPADQARIFERFFRADKSHTRLFDATGTGLGLSICQAVTAAHGGTIRCTSQLDSGSEFIVELPLSPKQPAVRIPSAAAAAT
jgi:signal transduction histidine kinase